MPPNIQADISEVGMHRAGTVFSRAGAEGASMDFWKPWIICHFPCSVTERPLCFPPPASYPHPFYPPLHNCHGSSVKKIGNCFSFRFPQPHPASLRWKRISAGVLKELNETVCLWVPRHLSSLLLSNCTFFFRKDCVFFPKFYPPSQCHPSRSR